MKTLFIPVKSIENLNKINFLNESNKLPKNISIAYSIQFQKIAFEIKKILSSRHKITSIMQVLGCSNPKFSGDTEAILLIGSGKFHAISLAFESKIPVFIYEGEKINKISQEEINKLEKKRKGAYLNFLNSKEIGIIISKKPGQEMTKRVLSMKNTLKNKEIYFFLGDNINSSDFENFGLGCWINSACPRMNFDYPFLNLSDLENLNSCN
jgi:diphthamide biosynthesis enzyme Dph1/Dph2-like protein